MPFYLRPISLVVIIFFLTNSILPPSVSYADTSLPLVKPGVMVGPSQNFLPAIIKGVIIHPENPFRFDFVIDSGGSGLDQDSLKGEADKLIKYFLACLTVPEEDLWVNLSPYEKNRIAPEALGMTELGRDLLAQDYLLKQLMASLTYPQDGLGKKFWEGVYQKAQELYGTTQIPMETFHKVWIVPDKAVVYEKDNAAFIGESYLKVMLEEDYAKTGSSAEQGSLPAQESHGKQMNDISTQMAREILIPAIEKEINEGQNFSLLRQIYHSLILAVWYKEALKTSLLNKVYSDQKKIGGIDLEDKTLKDKIYAQYLQAFRMGVYNFIQEDVDPYTQKTIPRRYFSGGFDGQETRKHIERRPLTSLKGIEPLDGKTDYVVRTGISASGNDDLSEVTNHYRQMVSYEEMEGKGSVPSESSATAPDSVPEMTDAAMLSGKKSTRQTNPSRALLETNLSHDQKQKIDEVKGRLKGGWGYDAAAILQSVEELYRLGPEIIPYLMTQLEHYFPLLALEMEAHAPGLSFGLTPGFEVVIVKTLQKFASQAAPYLGAAISTKKKDFKDKQDLLMNILATIDAPEVTAILKDLANRHPKAIEAMGYRKEREAIPFIRAFLDLNFHDKKNREKMLAAIKALSVMEDEASVEKIISIFNSINDQSFEESWDKRTAVKNIQGFRDPRYYDLLLQYARLPAEYLWSGDDLKTEALIALAHYDTYEGLGLLEEFSSGEDNFPHYVAVDKLWESLKQKGRIEAIIHIHTHTHADYLRAQALQVIKAMALTDRRAADYLRTIVHFRKNFG